MKFVPKESDGEINLSQQSSLKDLLTLAGGFLGILLGLYLLLGLVVDYGVHYVSPSTEARLLGGEYWAKALGSGEILDAETEYVQGLVDEMVRDLREEGDYPETWFTARVVENSMENAFATAGGQIFVTSGFLKSAQSENELVMVLGHEIGHILHRDPLRLMGRGLIFALIHLVVGDRVRESGVFSTTLELGHSGYSRKQEFSADEVGLDFLLEKYGHGAGATEFFERIDDIDGSSGGFGSDIRSTHPDSGRRVKVINEVLEERGLKKGQPVKNSFAEDERMDKKKKAHSH